MNYEEKYKQALSRATFYNNELLTENQRKMLVDIFPELAESEAEDERIRKAILELVKQSSEILGKQNQNNMIAWLDKQGEKDPCIGCTNDKGCVTCENGNLKEIKIEPKTLDADEVIEWIRENIPIYGNYVMIDRFKKDFG
ncbi:MAG: hypothetical protein IIZ78_11370 [Clostridiales bacterium]|nr:hypothetical protein [Clostridiales bacterium]MBQ1758683.1 hypothetical protein [Prevotella sp.]